MVFALLILMFFFTPSYFFIIIEKTLHDVLNIGLKQGTNYKAGLKQGIDLMVWSKILYQMFGQVINRVGKITYFGLNRVRVLGRRLHTPSIFLGVPPGFEKICTV